jgi:PPP family 3-phenylpropionic acid transporter
LGIYLPFFPVWLQSRGLGPEAIGAILTIPIVVRIVATAPLTALADRAFGPRRLLLASYGLSIITNAVMFGATSPVTIALLLGLAAFAQASVIPTTDFVAGDAIRRDRRLDYGRIRLWGSIAFLAANVAGGYALADVAPDVIIVLLAGAADRRHRRDPPRRAGRRSAPRDGTRLGRGDASPHPAATLVLHRRGCMQPREPRGTVRASRP